MSKHQLRLLVCAGVSLAAIVASALVMPWFRASFGMGMGIDIDLRAAHICPPENICVTVPLSKIRAAFSTFSTLTFWSSLLYGVIVAYQAGTRVVGGAASTQLTRAGYAIGAFLLMGTLGAGFLFAPESVEDMATVTRTWAPLLSVVACFVGFLALSLAVAEETNEDGEFKPVMVPTKKSAISHGGSGTAISPYVRHVEQPVVARTTGSIALTGRSTTPTSGVATPRTLTPNNPAVARTKTPTGVSVPRTTTPNTPGVAMPRTLTPNSPVVARTLTPNSPAVARTRNPSGVALSSATKDGVAVSRTLTPNRPGQVAVPRTTTPNRPLVSRTTTPQDDGLPRTKFRAPTAGRGTPVSNKRVPDEIPFTPDEGNSPMMVEHNVHIPGAANTLVTSDSAATIPIAMPPEPDLGQRPVIPRATTAVNRMAEKITQEALRKKLAYATATATLSSDGIDARREDGVAALVRWRDIVGVVARRAPAAAPFDGVTFVDIVSTAGSTLRILDWTKLIGESIDAKGDDRARALVQMIVARCPEAHVDPATRGFLDGDLPAQLPDADTLAIHDQRLA